MTTPPATGAAPAPTRAGFAFLRAVIALWSAGRGALYLAAWLAVPLGWLDEGLFEVSPSYRLIHLPEWVPGAALLLAGLAMLCPTPRPRWFSRADPPPCRWRRFGAALGAATWALTGAAFGWGFFLGGGWLTAGVAVALCVVVLLQPRD